MITKYRMLTFVLVVIVVGFACTAHAADVNINFEAEQVRSDGTGTYGTITEHANGSGATVSTLSGGQKVLFGTTYFNGGTLSDIDSIQFTWSKVEGAAGATPYTNVIITDGTYYGVIASSTSTVLSSSTTGGIYTETIRYDYAADPNSVIKFYEPSPDDAGVWSHGSTLSWSDVASWDLLGVGDVRPLHPGEEDAFGDPRGPTDEAIAIMWGDSLSNYVGERDIYGVIVNGADGNTYYASAAPEPSGVLMLLLLGGALWRQKFAKS